MKYLFENWRNYVTEEEPPATRLKAFVLVGPPSVGKSTWIKDTFKGEKPYTINRDDLVEKVASSYGWTYDDMFASPPQDAQEGDTDEKYGTVAKSPPWMKWAPFVFDKVLEANNEVQKLHAAKTQGAASSGKDIVVDMTNMNAAARSQALKALEGSKNDYEKIAVVFEFEGAQDFIKKVAAKRAAAAERMGKSKTIPPEAFDRMFGSFERVDPKEGFDNVVSVDNRELMQKLANS